MNHSLDADYWNTRYLNQNAGWDVGEVTEPLKNYIDQLSDLNLKILIPGAGNAYEAEYLVKKGFQNVFVCDLAPEPLKALKTRCPEIKSENLILGNFFELKESDFDMVIEQTFFCALNPSLRQSYFDKMHQLLKPKAKLVGLLFNDTLNQDQPPFGGNKEEYINYFNHLFKIKTYDSCFNSIKPRTGRELFINLEKI